MQVNVKLLSGRVLSLEVESAKTVQEVLDMLEGMEKALVAGDHWLLGGDPERRLLPRETLAECGVRMQADLRLVPRQRPAAHPTQARMREATEELLAAQEGVGRGWDELHDRVAELEAERRRASERHGGGRGAVKDKLKLTVGGDHINTKRSVLCKAFPGTKLASLFDGRYDGSLPRDPKDEKRLLIDWCPVCFRKLVKYCSDSLRRQPGDPPLRLPEVAPEHEAMLVATFRLFGLAQVVLGEAPAEAAVEGVGGVGVGGGGAPHEAVPPREQEPEPEDAAEEGGARGTATISALCRGVQAATIAARRALEEAASAHEAAVVEFQREQEWVQQFLASRGAAGSREVVQIDLLGERLCVRRDVLLLCPESRLARDFGAEGRAAAADGGGSGSESESESSDEEEKGVVSLDHSPLAFKALVDCLRLKKAVGCGVGGGVAASAEVVPPVVPAHEREEFEKLVRFYFPENEAYILGSAGCGLPVGAERRPGRVLAFGNNGNGQLGDGSTSHRHSPVEIASLGVDNVQVAAGVNHSLILKADGRVLAFGCNGSGQLGDGSTSARHSPVEIASLGVDNVQV
eukprot:COSAG02_NODE_9742_length_2124_cov_8.047901_1_plen_574_part_10